MIKIKRDSAPDCTIFKINHLRLPLPLIFMIIIAPPLDKITINLPGKQITHLLLLNNLVYY